jgi:hypothetical protein
MCGEKFGISWQLRNQLFIFHFLLVKAAVNALHLCKLHKDCHTGIGQVAMVFTKRLHFFIFRLPKAEQGPFAHLRIAEGLSFRIYYCKLRNEKKRFNLSV